MRGLAQCGLIHPDVQQCLGVPKPEVAGGVIRLDDLVESVGAREVADEVEECHFVSLQILHRRLSIRNGVK